VDIVDIKKNMQVPA